MLSSILEQSIGAIRFRVDDVAPTSKHFPVGNARSELEHRTGRRLVAFSHNDTFETIVSGEIHPLAWAVHLAFANHRPLCLTPDMVWILIAQGFAQHVNNHAEKLRDRFVRHQGQKTLVVRADELSTPDHWAKVVQSWGLQIRDHVGSEVYRLIECNFTTTTPISKTVSHIVMMDTFKQYFEYQVDIVCGIPEVTLCGTVEDWQEIYRRVLKLATYDLSWWSDRLIPICQQFINTIQGNPVLEFWQAIYMPQETYGSNLITGWLGDLFPYLKEGIAQTPTLKNPLLTVERQQFVAKQGIAIERLPGGLCQVPVLINIRRTKIPRQLLGGFIGVKQDPDSGTLQPELGWAVQEIDALAEVLNRLQKEHITCEPIDWSKAELDFGELVPKDIMQLLGKFDGATLYANSNHPWTLRQFSHYQSCKLGYSYPETTVFIDLNDGRCLSYLNSEDELWIVLGKMQPAQADMVFEGELEWYEATHSLPNVTDAVIVATDLAQFFERMIKADGDYYFDHPDFVADEKLENVPEVRKAMASAANTPVVSLEELSRDELAEVRRKVASNPKTPANVLAQLANDPSPEVRMQIAFHKATSLNTLMHLSHDPVLRVRLSLMDRPDLPIDILEQLTVDLDAKVRKVVAKHPKTPDSCLRRLAEDIDPNVQDALVAVPGLPDNHPWLKRVRQGECPYCKKVNQNRKKCLYFSGGKQCPD